MLNRNQKMYSLIVARLPLAELTSLYERSKDYPTLCSVIEAEIDLRIAAGALESRYVAGRTTLPTVSSTAIAA